MSVAINANTPAPASQPQSPVAAAAAATATADSDVLLSPQTGENRPTWIDHEKEIYQHVITTIGRKVAANDHDAPSSYAQLFDLASKYLAESGVEKSATQCEDQWYQMDNRVQNETLFDFTGGSSKQGTFGEDKLEVEEPKEEGLDSSFVQDEEVLHVNGDVNMTDNNEGAASHRPATRWEDRQRDALIELVTSRRELEQNDASEGELNAGQLFKWASRELLDRYSIDRTVSSCTIFWRRNIAGTCGFGTGLEATKLVSPNGLKNTEGLEDSPSKTPRETPTKSKRLKTCLLPQPQPQPQVPQSPKATARVYSQKLGRKFTAAQKIGLAKEAENGLNPGPEVRQRLAQELDLTGQQISGYFGNARFKEKKMKQTGTTEAGDGIVSENEEASSLSGAAPDSGFKTRKPRKRKRPRAVSMGSDDEPLLTPSIKQPQDASDTGTEEKVYGSRPGMLKRKAPVRDPSLPFLPPPSYEDSMLKVSPNPYGSPLNPPNPTRSPLLTNQPPRSSTSPLSLDPNMLTGSSLREDYTPNTATESSTCAAGIPNMPPNPPHPTDDHLMESILASKVSRIDEEISSIQNKIESESSAIKADDQELIEVDRQMQVIQARKEVLLVARKEKLALRAEQSNRIQALGNRKSQIAKALKDLKAVMEDDV